MHRSGELVLCHFWAYIITPNDLNTCGKKSTAKQHQSTYNSLSPQITTCCANGIWNSPPWHRSIMPVDTICWGKPLGRATIDASWKAQYRRQITRHRLQAQQQSNKLLVHCRSFRSAWCKKGTSTYRSTSSEENNRQHVKHRPSYSPYNVFAKKKVNQSGTDVQYTVDRTLRLYIISEISFQCYWLHISH